MFQTIDALAPAFKVSPNLLKAILLVEHGDADLREISQTADTARRPSNRNLDVMLSKHPMPGCRQQMVGGMPEYLIKDPVKAWIPTTVGWKVTLFRLDWLHHGKFGAGGGWKDEAQTVAYVADYLNRMRRYFAHTYPSLSKMDVAQWAILSLKAGQKACDERLKTGSTVGNSWVTNVCLKADELAGGIDPLFL